METTHTEISAEDLSLLATFEKTNTRSCTKWALLTWKTWQHAKNAEAKTPEEVIPSLFDLMKLPEKEVDRFLARFILEIKRTGGDDYPFPSIRSMVFGTQRYAKAYAIVHKTPPMILMGNSYSFPKFNKALKDKRRIIKEDSFNDKSNRKQTQIISPAQEEALWEMNIFGIHNAATMSDTVFFYVTKIFGLISGSGLRLLKSEHFTFSEDEYGKFVDLDTHFTKEDVNDTILYRCHGIEVPRTERLRHYCDPTNPRTFYYLLKKYIEEIENFRIQKNCTDTSLFLSPQDGNSFSNQPIGKNKLQQKFNKIMKKANMSGYFTNQSLVQSICPRLQAKGFNIKKARSFPPVDHLEICKVLDPPPGPLFTSRIHSQTKAILQLVSIPTSSAPVFKQVNETGTKLPIIVHSTNRQNILNHLQTTSSLTNGKTVDMSQTQFAIEPSPNNRYQFTLKLPTGTANIVPMATSLLSTHKSQSDPSQRANGSKTIPTSSLESTSQTNSTMYNLRQKIQARTHSSLAADTTHFDQSDTDNSQQAYPLFLEKANGDESDRFDTDETLSHVLIKQEPIDDQDDDKANTGGSHSLYDNHQDNFESAYENEDSHYMYETQTDKRKLQSDDNDNDSITRSKKAKSEEAKPNDDAKNQQQLNLAKIEYSFSNDLSKKLVKQEVSINDGEQFLFNFSAANKMGKKMNDLDLNLGDYLPDDCVIKPGDINLKRVVTSEGGKLVIQVAYQIKS